MTVGELIEKLKKYDESMKIASWKPDDESSLCHLTTKIKIKNKKEDTDILIIEGIA